MAVQISFTDRPDFQMEVTLERVVYLMRLRWNHMASSWAFDLLTRAKSPLVYGVRLVAGVPLLMGHAKDQLPAGEFYVFGEPVSYSSFLDGDSRLLYLSEEELLAL